jgi:hypothetical protein
MSAVSDASLVVQKLAGSGPDINATGTYNALTAYNVNDSTIFSGNTWVCTSAVTGGTGPGVDTAHWALIGTGVTSASLTALSDAIQAGFSAMVASRQSRRVGLLNAVCVPAALPVGVTVGDISLAWNENAEAQAYLNAALGNERNLSAFRVVDPAVQASLTSGYTRTQLNAMAGLLIDSAADFASLTAESLPA